MSAPAPVIPQQFHIPFIKNKELIANGDSAGIDITAPDASVVLSIANNPFPRQAIEFVNVNARAAGSANMSFLTDRGSVAFQGQGSAFARLAVFPDSNAAAAAVGLDDTLPIGLALPADQDGSPTHYVLLRWGFDVNASAKGQVALGAGGAVTFAADASAEALSAVIRRFADNQRNGIDELGLAAGSWRLPSQVKNIGDLDPGTWIIAEVEGSVALSLGVQYGVNYNWVRASQLAGLSGDIGLKLQIGASATLGFNMSGKYAVVVSRESLNEDDRKARLRLFKLAKHGFDFAFDAGVTATPNLPILPNSADGFLQAILGVHGSQIIADLKSLETWTRPDAALSGILAQAGSEYVKKLIKDTTGIDPAVAFDNARNTLLEFVDKWQNLDSRASSLLLKLVEQHADLAPIKQAAQFIKDLNVSELESFLEDKLPLGGFSSTPLGRYLDAIAAGSLLSLLEQGPILSDAQKVAADTLAVLDGSAIESILKKLQDRIAQTLGLDKLINEVKTIPNFQTLDKLLQAKLAAFLDKELDQFGLADLDKLRKAIGLFLQKKDEFYAALLKTLRQPYKAEFSLNYEASSTRTALIDIEFDFQAGDFRNQLQSAIDGDLNDLLLNQPPGVNLRKGVLTHNVTRHTHQELHLPYFMNISDHLNSGDASFTAGTDVGRVFVTGAGKDVASEEQDPGRHRDRRDSTLAVVLNLGADAAGNVNVHDTSGMDYAYHLRQTNTGVRPSVLAAQLRPYAQTYFGSLFGDGGDRGTFDTMITGINRATHAAIGTGDDRIGNTLVSLDLAVSSQLSSAWFRAQDSSETRRRQRLSMAIQTSMRRIIPYFFFQNLANYNRSFPCSALLAYACMSPTAQSSDFYFNFVDRQQRRNAVLNAGPALRMKLQTVHDLLSNTPGFGGMASSFLHDDINIANRIIPDALSDNGDNNLNVLFTTEKDIIDGAIRARTEMLQFAAMIGTDRQKAIQHLAEFTADLTDTFNSRIPNLYGDAPIRPLGTLVFIQACFALLGEFDAALLLPDIFQTARSGLISAPEAARLRAALEIVVIKPGVNFPPDFFKDGSYARGDVVIESRLVQ